MYDGLTLVLLSGNMGGCYLITVTAGTQSGVWGKEGIFSWALGGVYIQHRWWVGQAMEAFCLNWYVPAHLLVDVQGRDNGKRIIY